MKKTKIFVIISIIVILALLAAIIGGIIFILTMDIDYHDEYEIERKWIVNVNDIPYDLNKADVYEIYQTYTNYSPEIRVRAITHNNENSYSMTIKRYVDDESSLVREEIEFYITKDEYDSTIDKGLDMTIHKTRYQMMIDGVMYAFDVFHDQLDGLAYVEIEFCCENDANAFKAPDWFGEDVTNNRSYKNQSLAQFGIPQK